ncbi:hypothetical protein ASE26_24725 [Duganella sp. Root198D2]|nr:hypothetical protein ASE26_24725 [Duganella sp. Root198D2]
MLFLLAVNATAAEIVLELRKEASVRGPMVTIEELVVMDASHAALAATPVGRAPLAGQSALRSRQELADVLARQPGWRGKQVEWRGAEAVRVRTEAVALPGERLVAEAERYLREHFGSRYARLEAAPAAEVPEVAVPVGDLALQVRPLPNARLPGRVALWIDVLAGGAVQRSIVVPMRISAWQEVLVARGPLAEGAGIGQGEVEVKLERVEAIGDEPAEPDALQRNGRLRHAVSAGQVLLRKDLAPANAVLRGDRVRLVAGRPGMQVEVGAVAEADALVGQTIAVRPANGGGVVMARVTGLGEVRLDER